MSDPKPSRMTRRTFLHGTAAGATAVYATSPLDRCLDTAAAVLEGRSLELQVEDRLGECRYGDWTGRPLKELAKDPLWKMDTSNLQSHAKRCGKTPIPCPKISSGLCWI